MRCTFGLRHAALAAAICGVLGAWAPVQAADHGATIDELQALVQRQSAVIAELQQRVARLEARPAGSVPAASAQPSDAAQAVAARRETGQLQDQVADLQAAQAKQQASSIKWLANGIGFASADGRSALNLTGRIQYDVSTTTGSRDDALNVTGSEMRRLWLGVDGKVDGWLGYRLEFDIAGNKLALRNTYLSATTSLLGGTGLAFFAGNKKNDRGLDGSTSTNDLWFMEANTVANAIAPMHGLYALGATTFLYGARHDWHVSLNVADGTASQAAGVSGNPTYTVRAHWNPYLTDTAMVHVGAWGFHENLLRPDQVVFSNVNIATHYADVRVRGPQIRDGKSGTGFGLELAGSAGPAAVAGEYGRRVVHQRSAAGGGSAAFDAWAASVSWFLTREAAGYNSKNGTWTRPRILDAGLGALELVARYEWLDLNAAPLFLGGTGHGSTLGVNWYLNSHSRLMFDWIHWITDNATGGFIGRNSGDTFGIRTQITL